MPFLHPDSAIIDLQAISALPDAGGYAVNIRPALMAIDLRPYVIETPRTPWARWHDDPPSSAPVVMGDDGRIDTAATSAAQQAFRPQYQMICLVFPDQAAARASSLGAWWRDLPTFG